MNAVVT